MGLGFAPIWLCQVSPLLHIDHSNHCVGVRGYQQTMLPAGIRGKVIFSLEHGCGGRVLE